MIAVRSDDQWLRFRRAIGSPRWSRDPRFDTVAGRLEHWEELDTRLSRWTSRRTAREVMEHLQAAGVAAGMVQSTRQLLEDPHLKDRGFFMEMDHAKKGRSSPPAWRSACVNPPLGPSASA